MVETRTRSVTDLSLATHSGAAANNASRTFDLAGASWSRLEFRASLA
jgi:hypothetical protein